MITSRILDNFNRANGAVGANWTTAFVATGLVIDTNVIKANAADSGGIWNAVYARDLECFYTVAVLPTVSNISWKVRAMNVARNGIPTTGWSGYEMILSPGGGLATSWWDGASGAILDTQFPAVVTAGDAYALTAQGSILRMWQAPVATGIWAQVGTDMTDTHFPDKGYIGVEFADTTARVDNFGGGEITGRIDNLISTKYPRPGLRRRYS